MTCNDTQTHCLPADAMICKDIFLLMHTFWMDTYWMDAYWRDTYWWDTYCMDTYWNDTYWQDKYWQDTCWMDMCVICLLICMVWHTPTIFWRTLRPNVFGEKMTKNGRRCFRAAFWKSPRWEMIWRDYWISFRLLWNTAASWDLGNVSDQSSSAWRFQRRPAVRREKNRLS